MSIEHLKPGDMIFAATDVYNDGSMPDIDTNALIALAGARGVLVNTGHLEDDPDKKLILVRFEDENLDLGPAVACWPEELSAEPLSH
ncbi:MAG: nitrogen fixation protein NifZ [Gammaproteobacteria bacterium]|jgi:nitrogen fixation protein NifZ